MILNEKIREKSDGKDYQWRTAKKGFGYFDLDDKGMCGYKQFKNGLQMFGCFNNEN